MKSIKKVLALALALAMVVTAVPVTSAEAATTGVPKTKTYYAGKTYTLKLTTPKSWKSVKSTWSEKSSAVSLSSKKAKSVKVKAIKAGSATVKVKVTYKKSSKKNAKKYTKNYSCKITVKKSSISAPKTATVEARDAVALKATARPSTAKITYTSDNTAVATVDAKGVVTGVAEGTATITSNVTCGTVKKSAKTTVTVTPATPKITGAVATNATTITLSGKNLDKISMNDVKVDGYSVKDYVTSADFSTATVTLTSALTPKKEVKVTAPGFEGTVIYQPTVEGITVKSATYKAKSTSNQYLSLQLNGVDTTLAELKANGYTVKFFAYQYVSGTLTDANDFFTVGAGTNYSTDGKIAAGTRDAGDYQVKVEAKSANGTLISDYTTIVLSNNDEVASAINSISVKDAKNTKFVQKVTSSLNLVQDDKVDVTAINIKTNYNDDATGKLATTAIKSDNSASITVSYTAGKWVIQAHKAGTANLTVTYGTLTKTIPVTVDTTGRGFASLSVVGDANALINTSKTVKVYAVDNHGAYMIGQDIYVEWSADNGAINGATTVSGAAVQTASINVKADTTATTDADGKISLQFITGNTASAQATFDFYKGDFANDTYIGAKLANYTVKTVAIANTTFAFSTVAQVANNKGVTKDGNLDINYAENKRMVELKLNTSHNGIWSNVTTNTDLSNTAYKFVYDDSKIAVFSVATFTDADAAIAAIQGYLQSGAVLKLQPGYVKNGDFYENDVIVVSVGSGSATLQVKKDGEAAKASYAISVANTVPTLADIALATNKLTVNVNSTVDYKDLLNITTTEDNPVIKGVVLGNNTNNYTKVRLCTVPGSMVDVYGNSLSAGDLYVETSNGNLVLGVLMLKQTDASNVGNSITTGITVNAGTKTTIEIYLDPANTSPYYDTFQYITSQVAVNN